MKIKTLFLIQADILTSFFSCIQEVPLLIQIFLVTNRYHFLFYILVERFHLIKLIDSHSEIALPVGICKSRATSRATLSTPSCPPLIIFNLFVLFLKVLFETFVSIGIQNDSHKIPQDLGGVQFRHLA